MTVDRKPVPGGSAAGEEATAEPTGVGAGPSPGGDTAPGTASVGPRVVGADEARPTTPVGRTTLIWYSVVAVLLFCWFLFGLLVLRQGFVDSIGESLGTGFALLLAVSVVATYRRNRR